MTNQSFTFDLNYLKACAICASTDITTRYYLNGVAVQFDGKDLVAVSTDGHRMVCFNIDYAKQGDNIEPFSMIIPKSVIDGIKVDKTIHNVSLVISKNDSTLPMKDPKPYLQYGHNMFLFDPLDGVFPEWQRVIPTSFSNVPAQFNPRYLMDFEKISRLWTSKNKAQKLTNELNSITTGRITVTYNESGPAFINLNIIDIMGFGILMPLRDKSEPMTHAPLWATGFKLPTVKDQAA